MVHPAAGTEGPYSGRTVGQYRVLDLVGRGGMGEVYRAYDDRLKRTVAVKALPRSLAGAPLARERFVRETRLSCKVVHPYVATVLDVLEHDEDLLLVMEYIEGRRFSQVIREDRPSLDTVTDYALEISEGLQAIHKAGLVHRDLKPGNVMVTPGGHVKVMDFGVARTVLPDTAETGQPPVTTEVPSITADGVGVGTVLYMSPEQVRGDKDLDQRSDLFSLGIMMYEAITGEHPFRRASLMETAAAIMSEPPGGGTEPDTLTQSGPMRDVVLRLLAKDRGDRYLDAGTVITELRAVARGEIVARRDAERRPGRAIWRPLAVGVAVLALAVLIWNRERIFAPRAPSSGPGAIVETGRPGILVLPFQGPDDEPGTRLRGGMLASVLRADLMQSELVRVVGSTRTDELMSGLETGAERGSAAQSLADVAAVRFLLAGSFEREGETTVVAVDLYDREAPDRTVAFRAEDRSTADLIDEITSGLKTRIGVFQADQIAGDPDLPTASLASVSDEALLAAERGRRAHQTGDLAQADRHYGEAVEEDPGYVEAYLQRSRALYRAGYVKRAREAVSTAAELAESVSRPVPRRLLLELAAVRFQVEEDREQEIRAWQRLVESYPDEPDLHARLAMAYARANRNEEAKQPIDRAIELRPKDAGYHLVRARLLRRLRSYEEAAAVLEVAGQLAADAGNRRWEALVLRERGFLESALKNYPAARELHRQSAELFVAEGAPLELALANRSIAQTFLREGRLAEVLAPLERAAADFASAGNLREEGITLDTLGAVHYQLGDSETAESVLREALDRVERTEGRLPRPSSLLNLASVLNHTGRVDEAGRLAQRAYDIAVAQKDVRRQGTALLLMAVGQANRGDLGTAETTYRSVVDLLGTETPDERIAWAWTGLAEVHELRGDLTAAIEAADTAVRAHEASGQDLNLCYGKIRSARVLRLAGDSAAFERTLSEAEAIHERLGRPVDLVKHCELERGLDRLEAGDPAAAEPILRSVLEGGEPAADLTAYARAALGLALCETGREKNGVNAAREAAAEARSKTEELFARNSLARCLAADGRFRDSRTEALKTLDEAEARGFLWEQIQSAVNALSLPEEHRPAAEADVLARGRGSLTEFLKRAPGGPDGTVAGRPEVRRCRQVLGV